MVFKSFSYGAGVVTVVVSAGSITSAVVLRVIRL